MWVAAELGYDLAPRQARLMYSSESLRTGVFLIMKSTRNDGRWMSWSLLAVWLTTSLVVPAGAEEFSMTGCLAASGQGGRIDVSHYFACHEARREYEASRYKEAAERERQRRATEEATRQQETDTQAQEAAERAAKARQEAERARKAEDVERARRAEAERARKAAEETEAARRTQALQEVQRRRAAEQFMPGMCALGDLTAKCAMSSPDPLVEQIRRSQENAARGRPSR
jgi:flagellar biosynthesis GTPase FlhF